MRPIVQTDRTDTAETAIWSVYCNVWLHVPNSSTTASREGGASRTQCARVLSEKSDASWHGRATGREI
eukprot:2246638-Lingulodinium_polyedra.AAC.1